MRGDPMLAQAVVTVPSAPPPPAVGPNGSAGPLRPDINGVAAHTASLTPLPFSKQLELAQQMARQQDGSPEVAAQLLKVEHIRRALDEASHGVAGPVVGDVFPVGAQFGFEGWTAVSPAGSGQLILTGSGGRTAVLDRGDWHVVSYTAGAEAAPAIAVEPPSAFTVETDDPRVLVVRELKDVAGPALGVLLLFVFLFPLIRAWARTIGARGVRPATRDPELDARLLRIEQAVEAIAIEVERVGEAQRYQTKVLAERPAAAAVPIAREVQHAE